MLRADSKGPQRHPTICFALAAECIDQTRLTYFRTLAARGWAVFVLTPAPDSPHDLDQLAKSLPPHGVSLASLAAFTPPATITLPTPHDCSLLKISDHMRYAIADLRRQHRVDIVEFDGALGFRTTQAKRTTCEFDNMTIVCRLNSPSQRKREQDQRFPASTDDLYIDYAERYTFENADIQITDHDTFDLINARNWKIDPQCIVTSHNHIDPTQLPCVNDDRSPSHRNTPSVDPLVTVCVPYFNKGPLLESTLQSLSQQTYNRMEVVVIDDGSSDDMSTTTFDRLRSLYPQYRFERQENAGIGATRNRGLQEANGKYFIPVDADNIAHPRMVEKLVRGIHKRPELGALTSYFMAFDADQDLLDEKFLYAFRPTGGPRLLASMHNVYGDANAIFDVLALSGVGGFETDRDTSWEDWEAFVKLAHAGYHIDVIPDVLFYYRHADNGFSRETNAYRNRLRVLRQFCDTSSLSPDERYQLWHVLVGFYLQQEALHNENLALKTRLHSLRHRLADALSTMSSKVPLLKDLFKKLIRV